MGLSNTSGSRSDDAVLMLFNDNELSGSVIKLKSSSLRKGSKKPTNWKDRAKQLECQDDNPSPNKSPEPVIAQLDETDISSFATGRPLLDEPDYKICKHCKKPVIKIVAADHVRACLRAKAERTKERKRQREEAAAAVVGKGNSDGLGTTNRDGNADEGGDLKKKGTGAKKIAKKDYEPGGAKAKKRKTDLVTHSKEPKAKKKKEKPAKPEPKPKAPVDVERQCGVQLPNGALCARSLTCKSHSMGAKRSVLGRSQPYDILLAAYQKKNQAKQQKAAINAGGPPPEEIEANAMPVDSDEESEFVMAAIATHVPHPLEHHVMIPVRKKSQYIRMRDVMASALRPIGQPLYNADCGSAGSGQLGSILNQKSPSSLPQKSLHPAPSSVHRKSALNLTG